VNAGASLTVDEASDAYANAMRNPATRRIGVVRRLVDPGICPICRTFHDPSFEVCFACSGQPNNLDALAPITYSVDGAQMHHALRNYKDDARHEVRDYHTVRLAAILWRFLESHERCIAAATEVDGFDLVTTVPSKNRERDEQRAQLPTIVGQQCHPTADRWRRLLHPRLLHPADPLTLDRTYSPEHYVADAAAAGQRVLLIDNTWTTGSAMQSAAAALRQAGARAVAGVVIGRHLRLDYKWDTGSTFIEYQALPRTFDWTTCAIHAQAAR